MDQTKAFRKYLILVVICCGSFVGWISSSGQRPKAPPKRQTRVKPASQRPKLLVEPGDEGGARTYYSETFAALGITADLDNSEPNLSVMLDFLGYHELKPGDLEDTPSEDLNKRFGDDLLVSAFFAPKITDVSQSGDSNLNLGWRKIIRLRARPKSKAESAHIAVGFLLFNKFQGTNHDLDPMLPRTDRSNESQTTQLILVRNTDSIGNDPNHRPIDFFVFGPISKGAKLKFALQASFDAASAQKEAELAAQPNAVKDYFVPVACGQCHGGLKFNEDGERVVDFVRQKVNFLDTDHWFDRAEVGNDFGVLQTTKFGVLYDGGKDEQLPKFRTAFDILRRLNTEIKLQNERVELTPGKPSFQLRAISRWVQLHSNDQDAHQTVFARAIDPLAGAGPPWNETAEPDRQLLKMMNQYCYRCHSSVIYNVFDRPEVACRKTKIRNFLNLPPSDSKHMPQDRVLSANTRTTFLELISKLPDGVQCNK